MKTYGFPKSERLDHKARIGELFRKGQRVSSFPFLIIFLPGQEKSNRILISVSKRNFKLAVERNLIKRRIREAYRTSKPQIITALGKNFPIDAAILYIDRQESDFDTIQHKLNLAFKRLASKMQAS